jgi:RimJ/RimL family protein N-acetyltransferase
MHVFVETDRLLLRRLTEADVHNLVELDSDPEVMRFLTNGKPTPREVIERETLPRIISDYERLRGLGRLAAIEKSTDAFLGWIGFDPAQDGRPDGEIELGYRLRRSAWGRGYATEGSRALIRSAFESGVRRVFAQTMAVNLASRRVMEKSSLRFVRTFHLTWDDPIPGTEYGEVEYARPAGPLRQPLPSGQLMRSRSAFGPK